LDVELNYMKEIREAYFQIKASDISDDEGDITKKKNQNKSYEVSETTMLKTN
jgi:hypothetical protein